MSNRIIETQVELPACRGVEPSWWVPSFRTALGSVPQLVITPDPLALTWYRQQYDTCKTQEYAFDYCHPRNLKSCCLAGPEPSSPKAECFYTLNCYRSTHHAFRWPGGRDAGICPFAFFYQRLLGRRIAPWCWDLPPFAPAHYRIAMLPRCSEAGWFSRAKGANSGRA